MSADRWVTGDHFGLPIPADPAALHSGGAAFLTEAFRISGALDAGNTVKRISQFDEFPGGSTGRKVLLTVEYHKPGTHTNLFVKFSRDFDDPIRDRGKTQMESEVLFASLSREPGFPITVPATQFADYHRDTGTGLLISERIQHGANGIERQYHKCLDYEMPEPLDHYRALVSALGRLVGGHRSGRIPAGDQFPVDMQTAQVGERAPISPEKLDRRLGQLAAFAETGLPGRYGIGTFGRVRRQKGSDLFVEAMCRLLPHYPDFCAVVVGLATVDNLPFVEGLKQRLGAAGLTDRIRFLGELPIDEVPLWYQRISIYVFASRVEGFGLTMLEAMAAGDAVVATRAGAAEMIITDGDDGVLAPVDDVDALVAALEPLMRDPERIETMGRQARERVVSAFSRDREADEISAVYRQVWAAQKG